MASVERPISPSGFQLSERRLTMVQHLISLELDAQTLAVCERSQCCNPNGYSFMTVDHKARKRFGQNFLIDQQIIGQIISAVGAKSEDNLIEIGPGTAAITEHLVKTCPNMNLLELDRDLVSFLSNKFSDYPGLTINNGDALSTDFSAFYDGRPLRLVGNCHTTYLPLFFFTC